MGYDKGQRPKVRLNCHNYFLIWLLIRHIMNECYLKNNSTLKKRTNKQEQKQKQKRIKRINRNAQNAMEHIHTILEYDIRCTVAIYICSFGYFCTIVCGLTGWLLALISDVLHGFLVLLRGLNWCVILCVSVIYYNFDKNRNLYENIIIILSISCSMSNININ